jgi:hypothetical protein
MRSLLSKLLILTVASVCILKANVINDKPIYGTLTIGFFQPIGQTFQAVDALIGLAGFEMSIANPNLPVPPPITYTLHVGAGTSGPLIAARTIAGPLDTFPMTPRFVPADFTGTILNPGDIYTLAALDPTYYWGVSHSLDVYSGGTAVLCGSVTDSCGFSPYFPSEIDLKFEVLAAVPEPGTFSVSAGLILVAWLSGRFANAAHAHGCDSRGIRFGSLIWFSSAIRGRARRARPDLLGE